MIGYTISISDSFTLVVKHVKETYNLHAIIFVTLLFKIKII